LPKDEKRQPAAALCSMAASLPNPGPRERFKTLTGKGRLRSSTMLNQQETVHPVFSPASSSLVDSQQSAKTISRAGFKNLMVSFRLLTGGQHPPRIPRRAFGQAFARQNA